MGSKVGGAAPGFEPWTSCMRVRSRSHYTTGAAPNQIYIKYFFAIKCWEPLQVREAALQNWRDYESKEGEPEGHLLLYPVEVEAVVEEDVPVVRVTAATKNRRFPDTR